MFSPAGRSVYVTVSPQGANATPLSEHSNVAGSLAQKLNVALMLVEVAGGAAVIMVSGGVASPSTIVHVYVTGVTSTLPAVSNAAPSSEQTYVTPSSLAEKRNCAVVLAVGSAGPESIVVTGGTVSRGRVTVQLWFAGVGSMWPSASVARTATLWKPIARPVYSTGDVQVANGPPSSAHSNVEPARS